MSKNNLAVYILLDRSASMAGERWETAIGSINEYVTTLKNEKTKANITVATFDSSNVGHQTYARPANWSNNSLRGIGSSDPNSFDLLRNDVAISKFALLSPQDSSPRGGTPLYDSTAKLLNLAEKNNAEKTVIIIMTDGEENSSRTYTLSAIKDRIATCQHRGWEVIFLGAEFNADHTASTYGLSSTKVINSSTRNMKDSMAFYASATTAYGTNATAFDTSSVKEKFAM
jgi:von Willebrand factor type A domain